MMAVGLAAHGPISTGDEKSSEIDMYHVRHS
jgi:hypothetical protein